MKKIKYSDCKFNFVEYKVDKIGNVVPMKSYNIRKIKTFGLYKEKDVAEEIISMEIGSLITKMVLTNM